MSWVLAYSHSCKLLWLHNPTRGTDEIIEIAFLRIALILPGHCCWCCLPFVLAQDWYVDVMFWLGKTLANAEHQCRARAVIAVKAVRFSTGLVCRRDVLNGKTHTNAELKCIAHAIAIKSNQDIAVGFQEGASAGVNVPLLALPVLRAGYGTQWQRTIIVLKLNHNILWYF